MQKERKVSSIERLFENINDDSYPQNDDFDYLPIKYEQRLFKKQPIYCLTGNSVEILKISLIEWLICNIIYRINPWNANFDDISFDDEKRLIARRRLCHINDDIIFRLING